MESRTLVAIGQVEALYRYPVKSMAGERVEVAGLGWYGLEGDRRLAFRRLDDASGFPWVTAGKLPELIRFVPQRGGAHGDADLPTHVRTPDGDVLPIFGEALAADVGRRLGSPVAMMHLKHGIYDEASVSVIALDTADAIVRRAGQPADVRRFRPNVVIRTSQTAPYHEDAWVGGVLTFGAGDDAPAVAVTRRDARCAMVNLDPDTAQRAPEVMKAIVLGNDNHAGVYGEVTRVGRLAVGQTVFLRAP